MRDLTRLAELSKVLKEIPSENFSMHVLYSLSTVDSFSHRGLIQSSDTKMFTYLCSKMDQLTEDELIFLKRLQWIHKFGDLTLTGLLEAKVVTCAIGWAALHKPFNKDGLVLCVKPCFLDEVEIVYVNGYIVNRYNPAAHFFNLTEAEENWIFNPYFFEPVETNKVNAAIKRIERLVENGGLTDKELKDMRRTLK